MRLTQLLWGPTTPFTPEGVATRSGCGRVTTVPTSALFLGTLSGSSLSPWGSTAGSIMGTIRVWSTRDGVHVQTLKGHTELVRALLLGLDGRVYSASEDSTVRVWSGDDGAHLQTLEGHTKSVTSLAWGPDGKLYSGSDDGTIRVWSDGGSTIFKTTESAIDIIHCCLAWIDGNLFASFFKFNYSGEILVWSSDQLGPTDPPSHVLDGAVCGGCCLAGGSGGDLYAVANTGIVKM
jgi:WD40 repeat protein